MRRILWLAAVVPALALGQGVGKGTAGSSRVLSITPLSDGTPIPITKANGSTTVGTISTINTYTGTGAGLTGAPRLHLGTLANSGDDSALLFGREVTGSSLMSHTIRDESTFTCSNDGCAFSSWDANPTVAGTTHYNHLNTYQARPTYTGSGIIDAVYGHTFFLTQNGAGTVSNAYGSYILNPGGVGTITNLYGYYVPPLNRGANGNFAFYAAGNPSYLGGYLQINGAFSGATTGVFSDYLRSAKNVESTGTVSAYNSAGGISIYGMAGSAYGVLRAYSDGSGTEKVIALNPVGGAGVAIGKTSAATALDVNGTVTATAVAGGTVSGTTGSFSSTVTGSDHRLVPGCYATFYGGLFKDTRNLAAYYSAADGSLVSCPPNQLRVDANGPVLEAAEANVVTYSQTLTNAAWSKNAGTGTDNQATAPDNTNTAAKYLEAANSSSHSISQAHTYSATAHMWSLYVSPIGRQWCKLMIYDGTNFKSGWFDVLNGAVGNTDAGVTSAIAGPIVVGGNTFYRLLIKYTAAAGTGGAYFNGATSNGGADTYAGDVTKGYYWWGADMKAAAAPSSYVPTTSATVTRPADALGFVQ